MQYYSRLAFPQQGDSLFYSNSGRKHYRDHSQKLLEIVLPRRYALENPMPERKPPSSNPEHHAAFASKLSHERSTPKQKPLTFQLDELDKMKEVLESKKVSTPVITYPQ